MPDLRASLLEKLEAFDPDLLEAESRVDLASYVSGVSAGELEIVGAMMSAAFEERDTAHGATMLSLVDKRFRAHIPSLGAHCATLLDLVAGGQLGDPDVQALLPKLEAADPREREARIEKLPIPNRGFRLAHPTLRAAWKAAPRAAQYREPLIHRGEATPHLKARAFVELVVWLAEHVEPRVPKATRDAYAAALAIARGALETGEASKLPFMPESTPAQVIARALDRVARDFVASPSTETSPFILDGVAIAAVQLLAEDPDPAAVTSTFLLALDEELRRLDAQTALGPKRKAPSSRIAAVVFRTDNLWVVRLDSGDFGLLQRQGRKVTWLEGGRDDVLSSVPDHLFERAALAAKDEG